MLECFGMVSIVSAYRDLVRLREIYVVLVRHGFGELASRLGLSRKRPRKSKESDAPPPSSERIGELPPPSDRGVALVASEEEVAQGEAEKATVSLAERVRLVAQDLGPSFVKLGQIASTRSDLLPDDLIRELKILQDDVAPIPFEEVRKQVETSLARSLEEVYESFEREPLAAASIGQVHRAILKTSEGSKEVVVKVQRPGVSQTIARDLELLHFLAAVIERTIPESHIYDPTALVESFDRSITAELDYTLEADNSRRFMRHFNKVKEVKFPFVYRDASARQVLTLEFLPGKKIYQAINDGHSGQKIAKLAVGGIIKMIFEDGFFHADPHPGNILILGTPEQPIFGLIDLGMVGRLSTEMRDKTIDLMIAAVRQDTLAVADALYAIGTPTRKVDMRAYRAEASLIAEKYLGRQIKEIEIAALISDLVKGASKYGIEIPPEFLMVGKTLMTLDGIGKEIYPELDILEEAKPFFVDLLRKRYSPERMMNEGWRALEKLTGAAYDIPQQMQEVLDDLRLGRLQMKTSNPEILPVFERIGKRIFSGLVISSLILASSTIIAWGHRRLPGYILLCLALILALWYIAIDYRKK
jgi:ubiquinone biosynthesis protein